MFDEVLNISLQTKVQFPAVEFSNQASTSDELLVQAVINGDESAFELIFQKYKRPMARVVGRFFKEQTEVEEFVQQAFTKTYFSLKKFRGGEDNSFAAWITRIAVNVCYDEFRRRQRKSESLFTEMGDEDQDYIGTIADASGQRADESMVSSELAKKILSGLDADDRVALTLVYSAEYSLAEAAAAIGISTSSLKSRLFRCRNQLKAKFGYLIK